MIRQARETDLPVISEIYAYARGFMAKNGNPHQWAGGFPPLSLLQEDIAAGNLYAVEEGETGRVCRGSPMKKSSTPYLKFLCKFSRIFFRVYKFRNGGVAGYVEYSGLVQSGK